jgi:hypothetical protein
LDMFVVTVIGMCGRPSKTIIRDLQPLLVRLATLRSG